MLQFEWFKLGLYLISMSGLALILAASAKRIRDAAAYVLLITLLTTTSLWMYPPRITHDEYRATLDKLRADLSALESATSWNQVNFIRLEDDIRERAEQLAERYPQTWMDLGHPNIQDYEGFSALLEVLHDENDGGDYVTRSRALAYNP